MQTLCLPGLFLAHAAVTGAFSPAPAVLSIRSCSPLGDVARNTRRLAVVQRGAGSNGETDTTPCGAGEFRPGKSRYEAYYSQGQGEDGTDGAIDVPAEDDVSELPPRPTNPFFVGYDDDELNAVWSVSFRRCALLPNTLDRPRLTHAAHANCSTLLNGHAAGAILDFPSAYVSAGRFMPSYMARVRTRQHSRQTPASCPLPPPLPSSRRCAVSCRRARSSASSNSRPFNKPRLTLVPALKNRAGTKVKGDEDAKGGANKGESDELGAFRCFQQRSHKR